jgi:predicted DCC family thiol-disulfide oxidoreductase YuxK
MDSCEYALNNLNQFHHNFSRVLVNNFPNKSQGRTLRMPTPKLANTAQLTLYFDGNCPLCAAEMSYLAKHDTEHNLGFVDVRQDGALDQLRGVSCETALGAIHALNAKGEILLGVDVFIQAYRIVGLKKLSWLLSVRALRPVFDFLYRLFAKHRFFISRYWSKVFFKA